MLAKLRLDQTKTYEQCIASFEISKMIVAFVEGRKHFLSIGAEQGDIKGWDDFVIEENETVFQHIQVKRQQTPFSGHTAECEKSKTKNKGDLKLSTLDESMASLAKWSKEKNNGIDHKFILELPEPGIEIKKGLEIRQFKDFIEFFINSTTTVKGLENLQNEQKNNTAINIYQWLTTWCEFENWDQILKALQVLVARASGMEVDIDERSENELNRVFCSSDKVLKEIKSYCLENSTYTGNIAPRQLLFQLNNYLLPDIKTWTQIEVDNLGCHISGIHDLQSNTEIERPSSIVPLLWANDRQRNLKINIKTANNGLKIPLAEIFQFALHVQGNSNALCLNWQNWHETIKHKIGNTLGLSWDDCDVLNISENTSASMVGESAQLSSNSEQELFASDLSKEMMKETMRLVDIKLKELIKVMPVDKSKELRDAVEARWGEWKKKLDSNTNDQKQLFKKLLLPHAEGKKIIGELRIGPKTHRLIASGMHLLLIVSVALSDDHQDWKKAGNGLSVNALGLKCWSGPEDGNGEVRDIDDEESVASLIGREAGDILIITKSTLPETYILAQKLEGEKIPVNSIATSHSPQLLITNNAFIKKFIKEGAISPLRDYLKETIDKKVHIRYSSIKAITS